MNTICPCAKLTWWLQTSLTLHGTHYECQKNEFYFIIILISQHRFWVTFIPILDEEKKIMYFFCSEFAADKMDNHHSLWKLILLYLEGTQEVFDASRGLHLSEYKLISKSHFIVFHESYWGKILRDLLLYFLLKITDRKWLHGRKSHKNMENNYNCLNND